MEHYASIERKGKVCSIFVLKISVYYSLFDILITLSWFILSEWKEVVELFLIANNPLRSSGS
jgi:hypothetical protein